MYLLFPIISNKLTQPSIHIRGGDSYKFAVISCLQPEETERSSHYGTHSIILCRFTCYFLRQIIIHQSYLFSFVSVHIDTFRYVKYQRKIFLFIVIINVFYFFFPENDYIVEYDCKHYKIHTENKLGTECGSYVDHV